jgi:hypothetical protein
MKYLQLITAICCSVIFSGCTTIQGNLLSDDKVTLTRDSNYRSEIIGVYASNIDGELIIYGTIKPRFGGRIVKGHVDVEISKDNQPIHIEDLVISTSKRYRTRRVSKIGFRISGKMEVPEGAVIHLTHHSESVSNCSMYTIPKRIKS